MVRSFQEKAEPLRPKESLQASPRSKLSNQMSKRPDCRHGEEPLAPLSPSAAESSDYEPSLALAEEPYSPTDSEAEEDPATRRWVSGSLGAAELRLERSAGLRTAAQRASCRIQRPPSSPFARGGLPMSRTFWGQRWTLKRRTERGLSLRPRGAACVMGKQYAPAYGPPLYPDLLAKLPGPKLAKKKDKEALCGRALPNATAERRCVFNPARAWSASASAAGSAERTTACSAAATSCKACWRGRRPAKFTQALRRSLKAADEDIFRQALARIELFTGEAMAKELAKRAGAAKRQARKPNPRQQLGRLPGAATARREGPKPKAARCLRRRRGEGPAAGAAQDLLPREAPEAGGRSALEEAA